LSLAHDPQGFSIAASPKEYLKRGLFALLAVPALLGLLGGLLFLVIGNQLDAAPPVWPFLGIWCVLSSACALWGLGLMFGSAHWSKQSALYFDGARWTIRKAGIEQSLSAFAQVRVRRPSTMLKWLSLELVPHGGGKPLVVYGSFVPRQHEALLQYATWLSSMLRLPLQTDASFANPGGMNERSAAMLCYLPVQGVFIAASAYFVLTGDKRPLVRFSARQSLCQFALSLILVPLICGVFGTPVALLADGPVRIVSIVLLAVSLTAFVVWNLWAHILACSRAYKNVVWVMPWLRPVVQRWLPPA
jgi:uncharacterized membrane protein